MTNQTASDNRPIKRVSRRRKTAHLKQVPGTRELREGLRQACRDVAAGLNRDLPPTKDDLERLSREILARAGQPEGFVGWTMVVLSSAFWESQIQNVPPQRRLFLLPHCLKHAEGCPADYDEFGLACKTCGACSIADFRSTAEEMGYKVLVAEGSPIVLKIIVSGHVDAIVGVACLNVLEKAIDKILLAGIPCMAVPLLSSDCRNTSVDEDWVDQMIRVPYESAASQTRSYLHLMRAAQDLFEPDTMQRLLPRLRTGSKGDGSESIEASNPDGPAADPLAATESIGHDFLMAGGKYSRPFITLAVYDAMTGGHATCADGATVIENWSDAIKRAAMSIETFHKASLVHDDIQDNDPYRYGDATLHRRYGVPSAINIGDYLIGLGYRLVSRDRKELGGDTAADLMDYLADAHLRLSEGQGAELLWRDALDKRLKPIDALKIYALKTAPAFESALYCGMRLAGPCDDQIPAIRAFARNLGVAFQILNDLKDWEGDLDNKKSVGMDLLSGRPTLLWALAMEGLSPPMRQELIDLVDDSNLPHDQRLNRARHLYYEARVFETAYKLIDKHQERAEAVADEMQPDELRRLMYYLVDTVLERSEEVQPTIEFSQLSFAEVLPIVAPGT